MMLFVVCVICATMLSAIWAWFATMFFFWFDKKMKNIMRKKNRKRHKRRKSAC